MSNWRSKRAAARAALEAEEASIFSTNDTTTPNEDSDAPKISTAKRMRIDRERILSASTTKGARKLARGGGKVSFQEDAEGGEGKSGDDGTGNENDGGDKEPTSQELVQASTLLDTAASLKDKIAAMSAEEARRYEQEQNEARLLKEANTVSSNALTNVKDEAAGLKYTESMKTSWTCPRWIMERGRDKDDEVRKKWSILVEGDDITPPMRRFTDMKFPKPIIDALTAKNISRPTPIQMQGLPLALAGRDMVGIAFTGSGKTVTFSLPLVMAGLEEEKRMPLVGGEGPVGVVLAPSRELARQTYDVVEQFAAVLRKDPKFPDVRTQLLIGGEDKRAQMEVHDQSGIHGVVATPGRLRDFLKSKRMNFDICRYICLDEADRMLDLGFDEEVGEIMNMFVRQRQTLLFSATFPKKFQDFAKQTLVRPVVVNVGRAGAANLDVIQEVEYVKNEARIVYLLECLQKTAPPVCIFCERKGDVDDIHEYLLLKGVEAVSIHGGKDQEERNDAIRLFKDGQKDVLVSTDIAAKGLDFPDIQHVINFDMPNEIENYVHRIGRTGRCGKTGVATTFINKGCEESTLLDLKHLLREAKQRVPPVLEILEDPAEALGQLNGVKGCAFCGGLGHRITECPKIDKNARRIAGGQKDALRGGDGYGGEY